MEPFDVFTVRDLRLRTGDLLRDAEEGKLSIITKHGRPAILAIPFGERLLAQGIHRAIFIELLGKAGVPAVSYSPEDLTDELEIAR
jgi:prevent-host-death family protein